MLRHLSFWLAWWLYFLLCNYLFQKPYEATRIKPFFLTFNGHLFLKTFLLLLVYAVACYTTIYYLLPCLIKRMWVKAIVGALPLGGLLVGATHLLYWNVFLLIDGVFGSAKPNTSVSFLWPAISLGLINFMKVAAAATIIKYVKYWWLKQKESERLDQEKINAELQLLKAQVHPDFLFKTLNNIYTHSLSSSPRTSGMLLKLSDLLSYMLYECDSPVVPLEKEIAMMKEYMHLENIRHNDEAEMEVNIRGELVNKNIAPFLLLPFIENSFKHNNQQMEQFWINMDIRMEGDKFSMKLTNGLSANEFEESLITTNGLANVQKRLTLLYPGKHELKMTIEQEMFIVLLQIQLDEVSLSSSGKIEIDPSLIKTKHHKVIV